MIAIVNTLQDQYLVEYTKQIVRAFERMSIGCVYIDISNRPATELWDEYNKYRFRTLILIHPHPDYARYMPTISELPVRRILWDFESPYEIDTIFAIKSNFDHVLTFDKNSAQALSEVHHSVRHVPAGYDETIFYKRDLASKFVMTKEGGHVDGKSLDLVFIGNPHPERVKFFTQIQNRLKEYKVKIIGANWSQYIDKTCFHQLFDGIIQPKDCAINYCRAKVVLNLHRTRDDVVFCNSRGIYPSSPNPRTFEIAGCNTVQMVDSSRYPEMNDYFSPDSLCVFSTPDDFMNKFEALVHDAELRHPYEEKSLEDAKRHTLMNRISSILDIL